VENVCETPALPATEEIPVSVANFIRARLRFSENVPMPYQERKLWFRHCQAIRRYLDVKSYYGQAARHTAVRLAAEAASTMSQQVDIFNAVMDGLIYARFELPTFSGLDRIVERGGWSEARRASATCWCAPGND
jgi:hypothetical protein